MISLLAFAVAVMSVVWLIVFAEEVLGKRAWTLWVPHLLLGQVVGQALVLDRVLSAISDVDGDVVDVDDLSLKIVPPGVRECVGVRNPPAGSGWPTR
ncbi:hypothetical protein QYE76_008184 [Lolium multiflorum]|uniref:Uncharacterized protein n=1 Tax=Lolium multiflorum TaxID=4521 RepID=A0AAD8QAV8_LOLMU|nr:hypothetical protein QYE76_008184 [Lolium multiflorum]